MEQKLIKDDNYIVVQGWMMNEYGLTGDDLMTFAIIHGFSQNEFGWYVGGRAYIAEWLGCGDKKVGEILSRLIEKRYITRVEMKGQKGWKTYRYRSLIGAQNAHISRSSKGETGTSIGAQNAHININNNKYKNKREKVEELKFSRCDCGGMISYNPQTGTISCLQCGEEY